MLKGISGRARVRCLPLGEAAGGDIPRITRAGLSPVAAPPQTVLQRVFFRAAVISDWACSRWARSVCVVIPEMWFSCYAGSAFSEKRIVDEFLLR